MTKLYSWEAKRAGGAITISHSCGKIVGVDFITTTQDENGKNKKVVAIHKDGRSYELA